MSQYIRIILFVIFFCTPLVPGMAQTGRFYSMESGLSSSLVNKLLQDSRGFVWIATEYGLNRILLQSIQNHGCLAEAYSPGCWTIRFP